jgi:hypothetical protein
MCTTSFCMVIIRRTMKRRSSRGFWDVRTLDRGSSLPVSGFNVMPNWSGGCVVRRWVQSNQRTWIKPGDKEACSDTERSSDVPVLNFQANVLSKVPSICDTQI